MQVARSSGVSFLGNSKTCRLASGVIEVEEVEGVEEVELLGLKWKEPNDGLLQRWLSEIRLANFMASSKEVGFPNRTDSRTWTLSPRI